MFLCYEVRNRVRSQILRKLRKEERVDIERSRCCVMSRCYKKGEIDELEELI